jgi:hypothetical protein
VGVIHLSELQRQWRSGQRNARRRDLRKYLIERRGPTSAAYLTVARRLYADGLVDNLGLADQWIARASERERAVLFSEIATALLKV